MERHLPHSLLGDVEREGELYHVLVQAVVVRGGQLTPVRHALDAVEAKTGYAMQFADYPRVLAVYQARKMNEELSVYLWNFKLLAIA